MRGTVLGSTIAHAVLVSLLFVVRPGRTIIVPGPEVVQVALIGEPEPAPPAPVVRPNDAVVPDETEGVRIEKPRPKPKPEVKQQPKPPEPVKTPPRAATAPPAPAARTMLPAADVGGGLSAGVGVEDASFEFAYYLQSVREQITANWITPSGTPVGAKAEVQFRIGRQGEITGLRLATSSGSEYFDQTALRAVMVTQQLPPLPHAWPGRDLGIQFSFVYTGP